MRDYAKEFAEVIKEHPLEGTTARVAASQIVQSLRANDPALLRGWLDLHAEGTVTRYLGEEVRSERSYAVSQRERRAFGDAAKSDPNGLFELLYVVNDERIRKRLGDMTKQDHLYVAERHEDRSKAALLESAFHRALAKRVPNRKKTSDVLSEAQCRSIRQSLTHDD